MVQSLLDPNDPGLSNPVQAIHRHIRMLRQDSALGLQWVLSSCTLGTLGYFIGRGAIFVVLN